MIWFNINNNLRERETYGVVGQVCVTVIAVVARHGCLCKLELKNPRFREEEQQKP
jgi:hypothetical protein